MRHEGTKAGRHGGTEARRHEGTVAAGPRTGRGSGATGGLSTSALEHRHVTRCATPLRALLSRRSRPLLTQQCHPGRRWGVTRGSPTSALRQPGFCLAAFVALAIFASLAVWAQESTSQPQETQPAMRFTYVDVFIDAGEQPLAAYQFELSASQGEIKIVGVEGGEHPAFAEPPYYDPKALQNDRIIIAAFNTGHDLPTAKTRIARVHLAIIGNQTPDYVVELNVAATTDGSVIAVTTRAVEGETR